MQDIFIVDGHCDTVEKIADLKVNLFTGDKSHLTIQGLVKGGVRMQFFACWVGQKKRYLPCLQRGLKLIDAYYTMLEAYSEVFSPVFDYDGIIDALDSGKIAALLTVEGGEVLEGEIANLRILYKLGVRGLTLTWNHRNELADGVMELKSGGGLSTFGHEVVKEMNRLGMLIDVSHLSEKGFYDVLEASDKPIAATHSNAWTVCKHPRNLKDEQILALAGKGGVIGINFYPSFLAEGRAGLKDIISHIEYIASLAGTDVLGFGSDFDGIDLLPDSIPGPEGFCLIIDELLRLNYREEDVRKIAYQNFLNLIRSIFKNRDGE